MQAQMQMHGHDEDGSGNNNNNDSYNNDNGDNDNDNDNDNLPTQLHGQRPSMPSPTIQQPRVPAAGHDAGKRACPVSPSAPRRAEGPKRRRTRAGIALAAAEAARLGEFPLPALPSI